MKKCVFVFIMLFVLIQFASPVYGGTVYNDPKTGISFTVPSGWSEIDAEDNNIAFENKGGTAYLSYSSSDIAVPGVTPKARAGIDLSFLTKEELKTFMDEDCPKDTFIDSSISEQEIGKTKYYLYTTKRKMLVGEHSSIEIKMFFTIENGYEYMYYIAGIPTIQQKDLDVLLELIGSVTYPYIDPAYKQEASKTYGSYDDSKSYSSYDDTSSYGSYSDYGSSSNYSGYSGSKRSSGYSSDDSLFDIDDNESKYPILLYFIIGALFYTLPIFIYSCLIQKRAMSITRGAAIAGLYMLVFLGLFMFIVIETSILPNILAASLYWFMTSIAFWIFTGLHIIILTVGDDRNSKLVSLRPRRSMQGKSAAARWECEKCGELNSMQKYFCIKCGTMRSPEARIETLSAKAQSSSAAEEQDKGKELFGSADGVEKRAEPEQAQKNEGAGEENGVRPEHSANLLWKCKKCGSLNSERQNFCTACGTERSLEQAIEILPAKVQRSSAAEE